MHDRYFQRMNRKYLTKSSANESQWKSKKTGREYAFEQDQSQSDI